MKYNQKGQATIEYVLLLFVAVVLCMGLLLKLSVGFKNFAQNYLGEYVECLLETGELPGLGADQQSQCDYNKFTVGQGDANQNANGGAGGTSGDNLGDKNKSGSSSSSAGDGAGARSVGDGSSVGDSFGKGRGKGKGSGGSGSGSDKDNEGDGKGGTRNISTTEETIRTNSDDSENGPIRLKGIDEDDIEKAAVAVPVKEETTERKKQPPIKPKIGAREVAQVEESFDFSFGNLVKFMVIFLIILALIIFFGNQVMSYQKSKE